MAIIFVECREISWPSGLTRWASLKVNLKSWVRPQAAATCIFEQVIPLNIFIDLCSKQIDKT